MLLSGLFRLTAGTWSKWLLCVALTEACISGLPGAACLRCVAIFAIRKKDDRLNTISGAYGSGAFFSSGGHRTPLLECVTFVSSAMSFLIEAMLAPEEEEVVEETDPW